MWEFIDGAIRLAIVIAFGFTGWRATNRGYFEAVSERYYGRKAQMLGGICLLVAVGVGIWFVVKAYASLQALLVFGLRGASGLFFLLGAALGGYLTYRYYARAI